MPVLLRPEPGPATLKVTRWGGRRLAALRGAPPEATVGESWEFSTLPGATSRALGRSLHDVLGAPLPFLAKLLDTASPLSVQIHPGDTATAPGKEEAWIVLAADPGAVVWAGLRRGVSHEQFAEAVRHGAACLDLLAAHPVSPGAVVLVPARTVHAIGGGILLAEIQQPSDATLRFYDHGSDRPIQPAEALASLDVDAQPEVWRPQDPPRSLHGRHVHLDILGPGVHEHRSDVPTLVVPTRGAVHVSADDEREHLEPGALRLALGPCRVVVDHDSLCILGAVA